MGQKCAKLWQLTKKCNVKDPTKLHFKFFGEIEIGLKKMFM